MSRKLLALALLALPPAAVGALGRWALGCSWLVALGCALLAAFAGCDAWYFARLGWLEAAAALGPEPPRRALFERGELRGRVGLTDVDRNGHCNNARFLRECGFGRRDLWQRNGLWRVLTRAGGNLVVGAQSVRYRRELSLGQAFALETRLLCWDARAFYVEHRFTTRGSSSQPFVHAVVLVKNSVLGPLAPAQLVEQLSGEALESPAVPEDVAAWVRSNDISSKVLRAEAGR